MHGGGRARELQVMGSTFRYVTFPFSSSASILDIPLLGCPTQPRLRQPLVSRFVGSIPQSPPPSYPLRVFPHVAPYFSCFAAASRSTFIPYRNIRGARTTIRADPTYERQLKKFRSHWPRSRFHSTLCGCRMTQWGWMAGDWRSHV